MAANIWDVLFGSVGRAVRDVREKVIEEPWFGKPQTRWPTGDHRSVAQELGWVGSDKPASPDAPAHESAHDIDR